MGMRETGVHREKRGCSAKGVELSKSVTQNTTFATDVVASACPALLACSTRTRPTKGDTEKMPTKAGGVLKRKGMGFVVRGQQYSRTSMD